jgi:hypothetical protein
MSVVETGVYQHFKGTLYYVAGTAEHSETHEKLVIYFSLEDRKLWVRPLAMFTETVEYCGQQVPRFQPMKTNG